VLARFFRTGKWMLLDNYLIRALTGDHSAYKQREAEAMTPKANAHIQATARSTASRPSTIWAGEPLMLLRVARGCASSTTLQVDFNFSSTYSESSIMRSANCSAGSPAKFLSTNSFT
jgi:hypothetical protein